MGTDLYVLTQGGGLIYRSKDNGVTWQTIGAPVPNIFSYAIAAKNNTIYLGTEQGIYISTNKGDSWIKQSVGIEQSIRTIYSDGVDVYAGTWTGLYKQDQSNGSWQRLPLGLAEESIGHINKLGSTLLIGTQYNGLFSTDNDGETLKSLNINFPMSLAVRNNEIYMGSFTSLYHSLDSGKTWADIRANLPLMQITAISFTSSQVVIGTNGSSIWLRPTTDVAPPTIYLPPTTQGLRFLVGEPIHIEIDQAIYSSGLPIDNEELIDLITVVDSEGQYVPYQISYNADELQIAITIPDAIEDEVYTITIDPLENVSGLKSNKQSREFTAVTNFPPVISDIVLSGPQDQPISFSTAMFSAAYSDPETTPIAKIKVTSLPQNGTLKLGGSAINVDTEITTTQLSTLTYTPDADFTGTDQWAYVATDGLDYSPIEAMVYIEITPVMGIPETLSASISVYPNPVIEKLTLDTGTIGADVNAISIIDVTGNELIIPRGHKEYQTTFDFSGVSSGMYVLKFRLGDHTYQKKIVKK